MRPPAAASDLAAPLALDAGALAGLKQQAKADPKSALSAAAGQFEALFVQMLLKSMREALPQDGMLASDTSKMYTSMFDQQIAQQLSKRGIGLKQILERQLAPALGLDAAGGSSAGAAAAVGAAASAHASAAGNGGRGTAGVNGADAPARLLMRKSQAAGAAALAASSNGSASSASAGRSRYVVASAAGGNRPVPTRAGDDPSPARMPANVRAFVEKMRPHAEAAARAIGVPADLLLAQAGLETGWGRSQPKSPDGNASHNLFGIKAGRSWNGAVAVASTTEYVAGAIVRTVDKFRSYGSYTEAFQDFAKLLSRSGRYAGAVANAGDAAAYAAGLQRGGYATDPQYAAKLMRAIKLVTAGNGPGAPVTATAGAPLDAANPGGATLAAGHRAVAPVAAAAGERADRLAAATAAPAQVMAGGAVKASVEA
jgi:flagellar protein FlgJ